MNRLQKIVLKSAEDIQKLQYKLLSTQEIVGDLSQHSRPFQDNSPEANKHKSAHGLENAATPPEGGALVSPEKCGGDHQRTS
eukprot:11453499-Ditylum_brightwellii.AAC.1